MDFNEARERKARSKRRWNAIGVALLFLVTPLGVGVLVANGLDLLPNIGGNVDLQKSLSNLSDLTVPDAWRSTVRPKKDQKSQGMPSGGPLATAVLAILAAAFAVAGVFGLAKFFLNGYVFKDLLTGIGLMSIAAGGVVLAVSTHLRKKKRERFEAYLKLIGDKTYVPIHYLADVMGIEYHKVIKDLREMISRGILQPAWLDLKTYRLMRTEYTEAQAVQPEEKKEEAVSRSDRILRQIRADNDLIADEEVSRKIDRIEDLTRKIFAILDERPEKEEKLYSFLNYYLPTTLKALESYARLEAQGIETPAVKEAKQKINHALDELADGYEKQLDKLFEDDVVDITADIDVMRKMLKQDGLKADEIVNATQKR